MMESSKFNYGPAQKVGQMRISRKPIKKRRSIISSHLEETDNNNFNVSTNSEEQTDNNDNNSNVEENQVQAETEDNASNSSFDPLLLQDLQDRYARDIKAHTASRNSEISGNPGTNVKQIYNSNAQPRGLSH